MRPHVVDPEVLGEYVALELQASPDEAACTFPSVVAHLAAGCAVCESAARELETFLRSGEPPAVRC